MLGKKETERIERDKPIELNPFSFLMYKNIYFSAKLGTSFLMDKFFCHFIYLFLEDLNKVFSGFKSYD